MIYFCCSFLVNGQQVEKRVSAGYLVRLLLYSIFSLKDLCAYLFASSVHALLQLRKYSQISVACVTQDAGPQMPSDVTNLVKVGPNVVQVIGEFSGNCLLCSCLFPCTWSKAALRYFFVQFMLRQAFM